MSNEEESVSVSSGRLHFLEDVPQSIQVEVARSEIPLKTVMTWKKAVSYTHLTLPTSLAV